SALRCTDVSRIFPEYRDQGASARDFQPCGMELAVGRHPTFAAWMASRDWVSSVSVGLLQRADDDVFARARITELSLARSNMDGVEEKNVRVPWASIHRVVRA